MRILCIFAHPDDETAGIGGTIIRLTRAGHEVHIVSATDGSAGEVMRKAQAQFKHHNHNLGSLRREEFAKACGILGASHEVLEFADGAITNEMVWGKLTETLTQSIDRYQPDMLITFDHTGWYYHLDHVGVSIATTLAAQKAQHQNFAFVLAHVKMSSGRWKYIFPEIIPASHCVSIEDVLTEKYDAIEAHASQDLESFKERLQNRAESVELFQVAWCKNPEAEKFLNSNTIFEAMA